MKYASKKDWERQSDKLKKWLGNGIWYEEMNGANKGNMVITFSVEN